MSTMKTRLRRRLAELVTPAVAELVIDAALEELERPTPYMADRGQTRSQEGGATIEEVWAAMVRSAAEGY